MRWWLAGWSLLASCGPQVEEATAIAVSLKSDLQIGAELREVVYRVFASDADPERDLPVHELTVAAEQLERPFVVLRGHADAFLIAVDGYLERGHEPVISARARARFRGGETLALRLFLARACYRRECGFVGLSCYGLSYGVTEAGTCAAIPTPELTRVTMPGEESDWTPARVAP